VTTKEGIMAGEVRVSWQPLKEFTKEVFTQLGMPPEDAETEATVLI
jgi:LDH2 family malate/lactate/ureidoglycolate dehydrogenase